MAKIIKDARFCNRIDSKLNWTEYNPILRKGELGIILNGINDKTVGVIGDGETAVNDILEDYPSHNVIFFGQGAQYALPLAGLALGGVKNNDPYETGIRINNGIVYNELVDDFDTEKDCYVINKLYVKNLTTDREQETPSFEENTINLRYLAPDAVEQPTALNTGEYAGIKILNTKLIDGEFINTQVVIDNTEQLYVSKDEVLHPVLIMERNSVTTKPSFLMINEYNLGELHEPKSLTITNTYWPEDLNYDGSYDINIDLTPATITFNSQQMTYDANKNAYSIILDEGGLTAENAEKINKIPEIEESIENINSELANFQDLLNVKLEANDITLTSSTLTTTKNNTDFTVELQQVDVKPYSDQDTDATYGFTAITDIEVDEYGRVKSITKTKFVFM